MTTIIEVSHPKFQMTVTNMYLAQATNILLNKTLIFLIYFDTMQNQPNNSNEYRNEIDTIKQFKQHDSSKQNPGSSQAYKIQFNDNFIDVQMMTEGNSSFGGQIGLNKLSTQLQRLQTYMNAVEIISSNSSFYKLPILLPQFNSPLIQIATFYNNNIPQSLQQFQFVNFSSLKSVTVNYGRLLILPKFDSPNLEALKIQNNSQSLSIQRFSTGNYPQLSSIIFFQNNIASIPQFLNCPKMQTLQIKKNKISSISQFARGNYPSLKSINAQKNLISQLPLFQNSPAMQRLVFAQNKIKDLQVFSKGKYPSLKFLNLHKNSLSFIPQINAENLYQINISSNLIQSIEGFSRIKYQKLQRFNICNNNLNSGLCFINAPNLQNLWLTSNNISDLNGLNNDQGSNYQKLRSFSLWHNMIEQIPKFLALKNCCNLRDLLLTQNKIQNIQMLSQIDLTTLRELYLSQNQIISFKVLGKLKFHQLEKLVICKNKSMIQNSMSRMMLRSHENDNLGAIQLEQDSINDCNFIDWSFKQGLKKVRLDIRIYLRSKLIRNFLMKRAFQRKSRPRGELNFVRNS